MIILSAYPYTRAHSHTFTCWSQRSPSCGATSLTMYSYIDSSSTANFFSIGSLSYLFVCVCVCVCVYVKRLRWYNIKQYSRKTTKRICIYFFLYLLHVRHIHSQSNNHRLTTRHTQPQADDQTHRKYSSRKAWPSSEPAAAKAACAKAYFSAHLLSFANFAST